MTTRIAHRTCPLCEATCGLELTIEDDRVKVIRGDRDNPFSKGFVCPKGTTLGRIHTDPDRLTQPMIKTSDGHRPIGWDEAFAEIDHRYNRLVETHGRQAMAVYVGNPNAHSFQNVLAIRPLVKALGTRNVFSASTVDQRPREISCTAMFGGPLTIPVPDLDRTDHLLVLGANPYESNGSLATAPDWPGRLEAIRARGGRVVVVDPRRTKTAENADQHLAIRPGTDAALLLAMVNVLFDEGLVSMGRLSDLVVGLDEAAAAVAAITPEAVASFTGIPADEIRRQARDLAAAQTACVYGRIGTHTVEFGTLAAWGADLLNVLTGNLDRPGGAMFAFPLHDNGRPRRRAFAPGRWTSRVRGLPEAFGELPVATMADEMLEPGEGQVRGLLTVAGNPVLTAPDAGRLRRAIEGLELMISVDPYLNETTRHADLVLPPPSALEKSHFDLAFATLSVRNYACYSPPVFPASGPSEFDVLVRLSAVFAGFGPDADPAMLVAATLAGQVQAAVDDPASPVHGRDPGELLEALGAWSGPEQLLDLLIRIGHAGDGFGADPDGWTLAKVADHPHGVDLGPLRPRLPEALGTASGMIELAPAPFVDDVARLESRIAADDGEGLLLVGRRDLRSNNSWLHNVEVLVKGRNRCTVQINPEDASRLGVVDGGSTRVVSKSGEVVIEAEVTDAIAPGVVSIPYGWGHDAEGTRLSVASTRPGVNVNLLTDAGPVDPLSGNAVLNGIPVIVTAV